MVSLLRLTFFVASSIGALLLLVENLKTLAAEDDQKLKSGDTNKDEAFPDIFSAMLGKDGFRLQYEINGIMEDKNNSGQVSRNELGFSK